MPNRFWENFITPCSVILCFWPIIFRKCHPFQSIKLQLGRGEYVAAGEQECPKSKKVELR